MSNFHPFGLLKFIRDKLITRCHDNDFFYGNREGMKYIRLISGLRELGFIDINTEGEISTTEQFDLLLNTLDISLTQLENYSEDSIVCSPLFGLPKNESKKSDIFMVMPFLDKLKPVYKDHIQDVAERLGLTIVRGDDFFTASSIISDIWNAINSSKIIIADCTGRNPNVFYEIGIAHTLGKPVIFISQNKEDIPVDLQPIRYIVYEFTPRGMSEFEKILTSTIKHVLEELTSLNNRELLEKRKKHDV